MKQTLKKLDVIVFPGLHDSKPDFLKIIEKEIEGYESLLDVGCGGYSPLKDTNKKLKTSMGVD